MRLVEPREGILPPDSTFAPSEPCPNVQAVYTATAKDTQTPSRNTLYFVSDISPLLKDDTLYQADVKSHSGDLTSIAWVILTFINGRERTGPTSSDITKEPLVQSPPQPGSVIVLNGSTPRDDMVDDYHAWYDQEHGGKLAHVPGWQAMRRYALTEVYGEAETASFYGMNVYDEENGLGGEAWKAGVTDWTLRIRKQAAKPNIRRVWTVRETV